MTGVSRANAPASTCCKCSHRGEELRVRRVVEADVRGTRHLPRATGEPISLLQQGAARAVGGVLVDSHDSGEQIGVGALAEVRVESGNIECVCITGGGHGRDRTARHAWFASELPGDAHAPEDAVVSSPRRSLRGHRRRTMWHLIQSRGVPTARPCLPPSCRARPGG